MSTSTFPSTAIYLSLASRYRVMRAAFYTPSVATRKAVVMGLPLMIWGDPGVGKTSGAREIGLVTGAPVEVFSPGERGEAAIGVVPVPAADGYLDTPLPRWAEKFVANDGFGYLVLDELPTADERVQPGMMAAVLERTIGGVPFGRRTRVIATGNPPEQTPGGHDLAAPLANRLVHLDWPSPTVEEWEGYMAVNETDAEGVEELPEELRARLSASRALPESEDAAEVEARVLRAWPGAMANALMRVGSFLRALPGHLHRMPDPGSTGSGQAWASPRSWDMATRALAGASIHGLTADETLALVAGCVGRAVAREFTHYCAKLDLPAAESVLSGDYVWDHAHDRPDRTRAILSGITACMISTPPDSPKFNAYGEVFWRYMLAIAEYTPDVVNRFAAAAGAARGVLRAGQPTGAAFVKADSMRVMTRITGTGIVKM